MKGVAPWRQQHWDWRAAGNFACGGSGAGLLALAPVAGGGVALPLLLGGLALVAAGLALVWTELGRKLRLLNVLRHPQTSWMTREAMAAVPLFAAGLAAAWTGWLPLWWLTAASAMAFLYCQARMLHASKGIPAWRVATSVPLFFATGLVEGAGLLLLARPYLPAGGATALLWVAVVLLALRALCWDAYRQSLAGQAPEGALDAIARMSPRLLWAGHAAPALLLALALALPGLAVPAGVLAGMLAIAAGWSMKAGIVLRAAFNQGYALPLTPDRGLAGSREGSKPGWPLGAQQRAREVLLRRPEGRP